MNELGIRVSDFVFIHKMTDESKQEERAKVGEKRKREPENYVSVLGHRRCHNCKQEGEYNPFLHSLGICLRCMGFGTKASLKLANPTKKQLLQAASWAMNEYDSIYINNFHKLNPNDKYT